MAAREVTATDLLTQIKRDTAVLAEDPIYHAPDTAFYLRRIRLFKQAYVRLKERELGIDSDHDAND